MKKLYHVLMLKMSEDKRHRVDGFLADLEALRAKLDGFLTLSGGANCSGEGLNRGFTHGVVMTFADQSALDEYLVHPDHVKVTENYLPDIAELVVLDYIAD